MSSLPSINDVFIAIDGNSIPHFWTVDSITQNRNGAEFEFKGIQYDALPIEFYAYLITIDYMDQTKFIEYLTNCSTLIETCNVPLYHVKYNTAYLTSMINDKKLFTYNEKIREIISNRIVYINNYIKNCTTNANKCANDLQISLSRAQLLETEINSLKNQYNQQKSEISNKINELNNCTTNSSILTSNVNKLVNDINSLKEEQKEKSRELKQYINDKRVLSSEINDLTDKIRSLEETNILLNNQIRQLQSQNKQSSSSNEEELRKKQEKARKEQEAREEERRKKEEQARKEQEAKEEELRKKQEKARKEQSETSALHLKEKRENNYLNDRYKTFIGFSDGSHIYLGSIGANKHIYYDISSKNLVYSNIAPNYNFSQKIDKKSFIFLGRMIHSDKFGDLLDREDNSEEIGRQLFSRYGEEIFKAVLNNKVGGSRKKQKKI